MTSKLVKILIVILLMPLYACDNISKLTSPQVNQAASSSVSDNMALQKGGYRNINNTQLKELIDQGVAVIDIRLPEEWEETGIIEGSKTITFFEKSGEINPKFIDEFTKVVTAKEPVAFICRTGNRTMAASALVAQHLGYTKVFNVTNGITGWIAENHPVIKMQ